MHGEDEHGQLWLLRMDIADELETIPLRERDVHDHYVRDHSPNSGTRLTLGLHFAANNEIGFRLDHAPQPLPHDRMIIDDQDASLAPRDFHAVSSLRSTSTVKSSGHEQRTEVPPFPVDSMTRSPPNICARYRMIFRPSPPARSTGACANPLPSSSTCRCNSLSEVLRRIMTSRASLCRTTLVSASCTILYTCAAAVSLKPNGAAKSSWQTTCTPKRSLMRAPKVCMAQPSSPPPLPTGDKPRAKVRVLSIALFTRPITSSTSPLAAEPSLRSCDTTPFNISAMPVSSCPRPS